MTTIYATCPVCGQPKLRLEVWPDYDDMLICTCDNTDCKLSGFTITPDVYTSAEQLAAYNLTPDDVDEQALRLLQASHRHIIKQYLYNTAD